MAANAPAQQPTPAPAPSAAQPPASPPAAAPLPAAAPVAPVAIAAISLPADNKAGVSIRAALPHRLRRRSAGQGRPDRARRAHDGGGRRRRARRQGAARSALPIAAELDVRVDREETTFTARVHHAALDKLLPIFSDVLVKPRWDAKEFSRIRDSVVSEISKSLRQARDEELGKEALAELMYRGHPYGHLIEGHIGDLHSITLEDAKAQAARVFTLDRLTIGVSGGYPPDLPARLQKAFAGLPAQGAPMIAIPQIAAAVRHPRVLLVEKQSGSTAISLGTPWTLAHGDPDWAALSVARSAFGEHRQMSGRLMSRLRELRGLNYGDYAYIEFYKQEGGDASTAQTGRARHQQDFTMWLRSVQNDNRLFALRGALYELDRSLHEEPFTEEEVARTKGFLDGYLLLFDQTDARKLGYALDDNFYGQSNFLAAWRQSLDGVDAKAVNAAWQKWVHPEDLQIVMAGPDMAKLKAELLANAPSPIHYAKGSEKPQAVLDADVKIASFPIGASGDGDVEVVPVEKLFE